MDIVNLVFTCLYGAGPDIPRPTSICLRPSSSDCASQTDKPVTRRSRNSLYQGAPHTVKPVTRNFVYQAKQCQSCKKTLKGTVSWYCANDHFYCSESCRDSC